VLNESQFKERKYNEIEQQI